MFLASINVAQNSLIALTNVKIMPHRISGNEREREIL